ncbi:hypothetical protein AB6A40_005609 [Gnathostoma spinigerum]|uniref:Uncharacterized protein n=1 Tax=Gnathostoma spinigerum TaxID=75299 RepID=A0ABD6ERK8_9BILA
MMMQAICGAVSSVDKDDSDRSAISNISGFHRTQRKLHCAIPTTTVEVETKNGFSQKDVARRRRRSITKDCLSNNGYTLTTSHEVILFGQRLFFFGGKNQQQQQYHCSEKVSTQNQIVTRETMEGR